MLKPGSYSLTRSRATLAAIVAVFAPAGATGCNQTCEGAGCEEQFAGALIGVLRAADLPSSGESSPLGAWATIAGSKDQGPDADLVLLTDAAWLGTAGDDSVRGFDLGSSATLDGEDDATAVLAGEDAGDAFGSSLAAVPDWDGDGLRELAVGAPRRDGGAESRDEGAIYLYSGLGDAVGAEATLLARITAEGRSGRFGSVVAACGDLDGDGVGEIAASAPWDSEAADHAGLVWLGLSSLAPEAGASALTGETGLSFTGAERGERAGDAISCEHDLIGADGGLPDGVPDLVIGAPFASSATGEASGAVYILAGGSTLSGGSLPEVATLILSGAGANAWQGWSVATGDIDGDGRIDLAAGAPGVLGAEDTEARGQVVIWDGARLSASTTPRARVLGQSSGDALGRALSVTDISGDGRAELIIGAPRRDPTEEQGAAYESGTLYLFRGRESWSGFSTAMSAADADLRLDAQERYLRTGQAIRSGDLDGDGLTDLGLIQRYDPDAGVPE